MQLLAKAQLSGWLSSGLSLMWWISTSLRRACPRAGGTRPASLAILRARLRDTRSLTWSGREWYTSFSRW